MSEVNGQETIWTEDEWAKRALESAKAKLSSLVDEAETTVDNSQEANEDEAKNS